MPGVEPWPMTGPQALHSLWHHLRASPGRGLLLPARATLTAQSCWVRVTPRAQTPRQPRAKATHQHSTRPPQPPLPPFLPSFFPPSSLPRSAGSPAHSSSSRHPWGTDVTLTLCSPQPPCYYSPPRGKGARLLCGGQPLPVGAAPRCHPGLLGQL